MMLLQLPMLGRLWNFDNQSQAILYSSFLLIYALTLGSMTYCAFVDPGQVPKKRGIAESEAEVPPRGHKSWQYGRPIRRYDHYCKWVANAIGLMNHREFCVMLFGLVSVGVLGGIVDVTLLVLLFVGDKPFWGTIIGIVLHLAYSATLVFLAGPILNVHTMLVSRNELAHEWKRNEFFVVKHSKRGVNIPVSELSDDEYNALADDSVYDPRRNVRDHGLASNCATFWCTSRWRRDQKGDF